MASRSSSRPSPGASPRTSSPVLIGFQPPTRSFRQGTSNSANASWIMKVGRAHVKMQARRQGHRPDRAVGRDAHVLCLGHRGDLLAGRDPAAMGEVHLHDVGRAERRQPVEIGQGVKPFARGDRAGGRSLHFGQELEAFGARPALRTTPDQTARAGESCAVAVPAASRP